MELSWIVVGVGRRDGSEGRVAKLLVRAVVVRYVEVRRVGDVEALDPELHGHTFGDREVLEERQVEVAEVRTEHRIALSVSDRSQGLRSEGCRIEELAEGMVAQARIFDSVWPVRPAGVLRDCTVVEAVSFAIAFDGIVGTGAAADDREDLSTLPASDHIRLPSGESELLNAGEFLAELQFVVDREAEAVLDVSVRVAVFVGRTKVGGKRIAPTLIALLGEGAGVSECFGPGVVCIERQTLGEATLEGGLEAVVVRDSLGREITDATQVGKRSVERARRTCRIGDGVEWQGLVDAVDRFRYMLAGVADVANDEDVGPELLFDLHIVLLDECVLEVGRFGYERKTIDKR